MAYHVPVMLKECIDGLAIKPEGVYVDVTFGGGGHTKEILKHLNGGKLFSFDQDVEANFRYLKRYLKLNGITQIDGLLADLGISSHQIDSAERGFSTRFDADLDMRMDRSGEKTAKDIVATYSEKDLHKILGMYGEVTNAKTLAAAIVKARANNKINTVEEFKKAIGSLASRGKENKYFAQVFQALRIEVNDELKALEEMLVQSAEVLKPGGRLVVMSYHSLEDRLVKNFIGKGLFHGEPEKDVYGNYYKPFEAFTRKPVEATEEEVEINKRARSAKLRIGVKV